MYYTERLQQLREDRDLTQEQVANALRMKREQYRRYETGINEIKASPDGYQASFVQNDGKRASRCGAKP